MRSVVLRFKPDNDKRGAGHAADKMSGMWKGRFDTSCVVPELRATFGERRWPQSSEARRDISETSRIGDNGPLSYLYSLR
jgi:hypothetical protein